jgi:peptide/nickel transport system substrate-binding protein
MRLEGIVESDVALSEGSEQVGDRPSSLRRSDLADCRKEKMLLRIQGHIRSKRDMAVLSLLLVALFSACAQPESIPRSVGDVSTSMSDKQTIIVGLVYPPSSLDPGDHRERQSETVIRNMFDGLVTRDTRSGVHLELAEEIDWLDERTLEIKLRKGVLFHDGVEMTADDVVFTFRRIIQEDAIEYPEPHTSARRGLITPLESADRVDEHTVMMRFTDPWPPALQMLVHQQIVPRHYLEEVGTQGFIQHPIGTGPFKFVSAQSDLQEIVLERFDDYYGGAPDLPPVGPPCADRVVFRTISDALTRAAAVRAGEMDIIQSVPLDLAEILADHPRVRVLEAPGTRPVWMDLNVNQPPFNDVRVRQALNYAVDKEGIIDKVYGGRAFLLAGPLSPFNTFANQGLEPYPWDLQKAGSLLRQAGWLDSDDDGILDSQGEPFQLTLDTLELWRPLAEAVADSLQTTGIEVTVRFWDRAVVRPHLLAGERMAYLDGWGDSAFDPVGHFEAKWHAYVEGQPYGRGNYSGYDNEKVNELIRMGEVTADRAERQRIYDEAQRIIYEEAPAVFLVLPEEIEAASVRVQNWEPASDGRINLHDICVSGQS